MSKIKAVLFEVDGALIDSVDAHARAWQDVLARHGYELHCARGRHQIGKGGEKVLPALLTKEVVEREAEQIERERPELFSREYLPRLRPFPGNRPLFERITA